MNDCADFRKLAILLPVRDEVISLRETVLGIESSCDPADVSCIQIVFAPNATEACRAEVNRLCSRELPIPLRLLQEKGGNLGEEFKEILRFQTDASHCLIWTADQDAPPEMTAQMLKKAKENPAAVIKLSRFIPGAALPSSKGKFINWRDSAFRWFVCKLYGNHQTDPHFGLTLFPMHDVFSFKLKEKFMSFTIEYTLCFDRLGVEFIEIPLRQQVRPEGKSNLSVYNKLRYFIPVFRVRFAPKHMLFLKDGADEKT